MTYHEYNCVSHKITRIYSSLVRYFYCDNKANGPSFMLLFFIRLLLVKEKPPKIPILFKVHFKKVYGIKNRKMDFVILPIY